MPTGQLGRDTSSNEALFPAVSRLCQVTIKTNQDILPGQASFEKHGEGKP